MVTRIFSPKGGLELYAHCLVEGLLSAGHQVTVVCEQKHSELIHKNLKILQFAGPGKKLDKGQRLEFYFDKVSKLLAELGPFDIIHSQHLAVKNVDVAHFHDHTVAKLTRNGRPWENFVNAAKGKFSHNYKKRFEFDKLLASQAKVLMFPSLICQRDFEETYDLLSFRSAKSHLVAYPGYSTTFAEATNKSDLRASEGNSPPVRTFLFVGRGYRKKGLDVLLKACSELARRGVNFKLLLAGIRLNIVTKLQINAFGIAEYVEELGFVENMSPVYQKAQVMVQPSRYEPFGMAVVQGMKHGLVPIVSEVSGVSEVLRSGHDSLILKNHLDHNELADLMNLLAKDVVLLERLRSHVGETSSRFSWGSTLCVTEEAYKQVLKEKNVAAASRTG
jgi:glycosyltransferase involved in cell wall biosynthesis